MDSQRRTRASSVDRIHKAVDAHLDGVLQNARQLSTRINTTGLEDYLEVAKIFKQMEAIFEGYKIIREEGRRGKNWGQKAADDFKDVIQEIFHPSAYHQLRKLKYPIELTLRGRVTVCKGQMSRKLETEEGDIGATIEFIKALPENWINEDVELQALIKKTNS